MNEPMKKGTLELEVADFGPIVRAKVDLRPLTVFIGPSNTGKSYLAILIYALHQVFGGYTYTRFGRIRFRGIISPALFRRYKRDLSEENIEALLKLANSLADDPGLRDRDNITLPPQVTDLLSFSFDNLAGALSREIRRCFGIGESHALIHREQTRTSRIVMRRRIPDQTEISEHTISLARKSGFKTMVPAEVPIPVDFNPENEIDLTRDFHFILHHIHTSRKISKKSSSQDFMAFEFLQTLDQMVRPSLFGPLHLPAYYLPADRTGIMHAHSVVVSALIANASTAGLHTAVPTPILSGVLADFLKELIAIAQEGPASRKTKRGFGKKIEDAILGGSVRIEQSPSTNYPRFVYQPHRWKNNLALANASSMVSELAPVVLYLRHIIKPDNVLIVEEPESHLHPAMQVEFTRQLAALADAGFRVIVTTHSEWLLDELANIVRRSKLPKAARGDKIALRPDQVGAWLFEPKKRPKGSVVKELRLDDTGMYPSGYDEVAKGLHNDWADIISSRIERR